MKDAEVVLKSDKANFQMLYFTCSSLSQDDSKLYGLTDMTGSPNIFSYDLRTGKLDILSDNQDGILRSYVYFNGEWDKGLGKASVVLDSERNILYYIQGTEIRRIKNGTIAKLNNVRGDRVTAFMHVSPDGKMLAVPSTDRRALEYDLDTEGYGLDRRPVSSVDERCIREHLSSYLSFYDTETGALIREVTVPDFLMEDDKVILTVYGINSTMGIVGSYMGPTMTIVTSDKEYKALNNSVHVVVSDKETIMGIINKSLSQRFIASITVLSEANIIRFEMGLPFAPAYMYFPNGYPTDQTTETNQEDNTNVADQESVH